MEPKKPVVFVPAVGEKAYEVAGTEFSILWGKISGSELTVKKATNQLPDGDIILIGADAVNSIAYELVKSGSIASFKPRYGSDDYQMLTLQEGCRKILILAGGCGRSTLYAVYDYFHRTAGVEYFWDGDIIKQNSELEICNIDILERPRFKYRGLRYFAHRGLHRFQAEHWSFEDWKREIDWVLKKRMNFFMLRTGIDDLFQRAFGLEYPPEDGPDPDRVDRCYNDRTSPWSLKYRGQLRKKVMRYAFDRGLLHPADSGTITHWYSHTPSSFYKKYPDFPLLKQRTGCYEGIAGAQIWDIEHQQAWDAYWKLTETAINEFGQEQSRLFHTIGLAERKFGADAAENFRIKKYSLRKIQQEIRERYPDSPLLLASWDMWQEWENEEVIDMLKEMDPERVIMLDYTADFHARKTYKDWHVYKQFPWIFGIFHAFEWQNEIRNDYGLLEERVSEAAEDEKCEGFVFWPELSHSDTFMLEYLAENSWSPEDPSKDHAVTRFCTSRYSKEIVSVMENVWSNTLAITRNEVWWHTHPDYSNVLTPGKIPDNETLESHKKKLQKLDPDLAKGKAVLNSLSELTEENFNDEMWRRDAVDISRSIISIGLNAEIWRLYSAMNKWSNGKCSLGVLSNIIKSIRNMTIRLADVLSTSREFSVYFSMQRLAEEAPINPHTEQTLKGNIENGYSRTQAYELVKHLYAKEIDVFLTWIEEKISAEDKTPLERPEKFSQIKEQLQDQFYEVSLAKMAPSQCNCSAKEFAQIMKISADQLGKLELSKDL